jgi:hypothetical protein
MNIKQYITTAGLVSVMAASANALTINVASYPEYDGGIHGGEFTIYNSPWGGSYSPVALASYLNNSYTGFQTFCLEGNENWFSTVTATLSDSASLGGLGGGSPDPIGVGTAWLYKQFAMGTLASYNYGVGRNVSAAQLQSTIWWLEQEASDPGSSNPFQVAVLAAFGSLANARADAGANNTYGVLVVNMDYLQRPKQSMLVYLPDGGTTLALLGMAFCGLGLIRRKI